MVEADRAVHGRLKSLGGSLPHHRLNLAVERVQYKRKKAQCYAVAE